MYSSITRLDAVLGVGMDDGGLDKGRKWGGGLGFWVGRCIQFFLGISQELWG